MKGLTGSLLLGRSTGYIRTCISRCRCIFCILGFSLHGLNTDGGFLALLLTIMLAWGSNFMPLTDFFIDYVPVYNKFRPVFNSGCSGTTFPFIAIIGLYRFFTDEKLTTEYKQKVLLHYRECCRDHINLILLVKLFLVSTALEGQYLPSYLLDYLVGERYSMFRTDAVKAIYMY